MRTTVPDAFCMSFDGPDGPYEISFEPIDEWDGVISVKIRELDMEWPVMNAERATTGTLVLGGITHGSENIWNDVFWFELHMNEHPPLIRFWGDRILWREDRSNQA